MRKKTVGEEEKAGEHREDQSEETGNQVPHFSPEEQAVVNALNEIATACTGAKKFEGPSVAAVDAFKTSLENFTVEQLVAVDASTIILESLLNQPKNFVARESGVAVVQSILEKFGERKGFFGFLPLVY